MLYARQCAKGQMKISSYNFHNAVMLVPLLSLLYIWGNKELAGLSHLPKVIELLTCSLPRGWGQCLFVDHVPSSTVKKYKTIILFSRSYYPGLPNIPKGDIARLKPQWHDMSVLVPETDLNIFGVRLGQVGKEDGLNKADMRGNIPVQNDPLITCHFLLAMYFFIRSLESFLASMFLVSFISHGCWRHWVQSRRFLTEAEIRGFLSRRGPQRLLVRSEMRSPVPGHAGQSPGLCAPSQSIPTTMIRVAVLPAFLLFWPGLHWLDSEQVSVTKA